MNGVPPQLCRATDENVRRLHAGENIATAMTAKQN
jgi:hypothetical protein